jgi:ADP-ribose pyrophosphatase
MGKLPKDAKRVFNGIIFDVFHWEQKMFDETFQTFEMLKRPDTVSVIPIDSDGKLIISNEEQPGRPAQVGLIGGRVDKGEEPLEAAKRELLEESGYTAKDFQLWIKTTPLEKVEWSTYIFIARNIEKVQEQKLEAGEKIKLLKVTFDDFINKYIVSEDFRDFECALEILRAKNDPDQFLKLKKQFTC